MSLVQLARDIAEKAHAGQFDKAGEPYFKHPLFVASLLESDDEKAVAFLHDVIEDTAVTIEELSTVFPPHIVEAVRTLTRKSTENYADYILRVKQNQLATAVKLADLTHNMDLNRIIAPTEVDLARIEKYKKAYSILTESDADNALGVPFAH
jgi:(p)ppGpp synthase/HD superfamily hydrolase